MKRWDDERTGQDAPVWFGAEEAAAWAAGWNAAVREATEQLDIALDRESMRELDRYGEGAS